MSKTLKLWNGRGYYCRKPDDPKWGVLPINACPHAYVAAYSRADAARVIGEYRGKAPVGMDREIKSYWSECWGSAMSGVTPERGLWISFDGSRKPERVL